MEYQQVKDIVGMISNPFERKCLNVYSRIAFELPIPISDIDLALTYFRAKGYEISPEELEDPTLGSRTGKVVLLDNLVASAHERERNFSSIGLVILNLLAS